MRKGKIVLIVAVAAAILVLSGCQQSDVGGKQEESGMATVHTWAEGTYEYKEGVYPVKRWEAPVPGAADGADAGSVTEEMAISIARGEFEKIQQTGIGKDYVLRGVFNDTEEGVWIVYFSSEPLVPGNCYNIAISKNTGDVLNTWPGE